MKGKKYVYDTKLKKMVPWQAPNVLPTPSVRISPANRLEGAAVRRR